MLKYYLDVPESILAAEDGLLVWHVIQKNDALLQETTLEGFWFGGTCWLLESQHGLCIIGTHYKYRLWLSHRQVTYILCGAVHHWHTLPIRNVTFSQTSNIYMLCKCTSKCITPIYRCNVWLVKMTSQSRIDLVKSVQKFPASYAAWVGQVAPSV